jgi:cytochrome oxidase Cu insertion factor (SCO1/SenC/PrrC family)
MSTSVSGAAATRPDPARARRRGRLIALALFAACAVPVVAGYLAYFYFPPSGRVNYGELVDTRPLPGGGLARPGGAPFGIESLRGKWVLLHVDRAECPSPCAAKLFNMRQVRLAQGKDMDRVERLWVLLDESMPGPELARLTEGVVLARSLDGALVRALPAPSEASDHVYLVDPLGNLVLRFPKDADPKRMIKDLQRLLKYSGIG